MLGKVKRRRDRRPKVSMVTNAGIAKMKLTAPKPKEPKSAMKSEAPPSRKIVEE
jgi:hypothetical protein